MDLLSKTESAAEALTATVTSTMAGAYVIRTGLDDDEYQLPNIILTASDTGEQIPPNTGNKIVTLRATINANPSDMTLENFTADASLLFDLFNSDDIGAQLSAQVLNFYAYDPPKDNRETSQPQDGKMSKSIELDLLCCESDI